MPRPLILALLASTLVGCSKKPAPESAPTPATAAVEQAEQLSAQIEAQTGVPVTSMTVRYTEPPEDVYVAMFVAAAGWAKGFVGGRNIGVYQFDNAPPRFRRGIEAVTNRYAFRPIGPSDYGVVCGGNAPSQTSVTSRNARCSMKYVDAVLVINSVFMGRDSGWVGSSVTRVPTGASRSETVRYCITLVRKQPNEWEAKRSERILETTRCPRNLP